MGKNIVRNKALREASAGERDSILQSAYQLRDLPIVRQIEDDSEKYFIAAAALYRAALDSGIPAEDAKAQLTATNIAAVAETGWDSPNNTIRLFAKRVVKSFGSTEHLRRLTIAWASGLPEGADVIGTQETLDEILAGLKVSEERKCRGVTFSCWDMLQDTKIPEITPKTMFILGVYVGDGYVDDSLNQVSLLGTQHDFPFYRDVVSLLVKELFNLHCPVKTSYARELDIRSPKINISSQAHHTWLGYIGFPVNGNGIKIDFGGDDALLEAFFAGIVASMGSIDPTQKALKIPDTDAGVLEFIRGVSVSAGYFPSQNRPSFRGLCFTRDDTRRMAKHELQLRFDVNSSGVEQKGIYVNPREIDALKRLGI